MRLGKFRDDAAHPLVGSLASHVRMEDCDMCKAWMKLSTALRWSREEADVRLVGSGWLTITDGDKSPEKFQAR